MNQTKHYELSYDAVEQCDVYKILLPWIEPNSRILECGCASGSLTRYLSEKLNCEVSIIEIDQANYRQAVNYAVDGYCGNLNEEGWYRYYQDKQFDYVLFTDVLEHLLDPLDTLTKTASLLKPTGKVIFSIPNICHNDIIIQLYNNNFNYTSWGLLDDTHIHFWGINNLHQFCNNAGLKIIELQGTTISQGQTEQKALFDVDEDLLKALEKRPYGNIYQIVGLCAKKDLGNS